MSSKELPMSSDESSTIDEGIKFSVPNSPTYPITNPWGHMNVDDISIEIVDHLSFSGDEENCDEVQVIESSKGPQIVYSLLTIDDHKIAALKFNLVINGKSHPVRYPGIRNHCPYPPIITNCAQGNGACLFNLFSLLLNGTDTYSAIIRHVTCNYISNPVKHK